MFESDSSDVASFSEITGAASPHVYDPLGYIDSTFAEWEESRKKHDDELAEAVAAAAGQTLIAPALEIAPAFEPRAAPESQSSPEVAPVAQSFETSAPESVPESTQSLSTSEPQDLSASTPPASDS